MAALQVMVYIVVFPPNRPIDHFPYVVDRIIGLSRELGLRVRV